MTNPQTEEYFERERQSWLARHKYYNELSQSVDKIDRADEILWNDEVEPFIVYEDELDEDWEKVIDTYRTDRDWIDEAVKNYYEPLSIEKRVRVNPRDSSQVIDRDDAIYKLQITIWWPNVFWNIDWTAELHLYWWGEHLSRDFGVDFANDLLSFYWLE